MALGHIHKHQVLGKDPLIVYSGSPQRIDFGEEKEEKGICLVEILPSVIPAKAGIHTNKLHGSQIKSGMTSFDITFQFITTNARKFLTITVDLKNNDKNPTETIIDEISKHEIEEKIVRLVINIPSQLDQDIQMDKIKKALSTSHLIAGISRNVERVEREKIDLGENVETLTPLSALKKYFKAKKYSESQQKKLQEYAAQLLES